MIHCICVPLNNNTHTPLCINIFTSRPSPPPSVSARDTPEISEFPIVKHWI